MYPADFICDNPSHGSSGALAAARRLSISCATDPVPMLSPLNVAKCVVKHSSALRPEVISGFFGIHISQRVLHRVANVHKCGVLKIYRHIYIFCIYTIFCLIDQIQHGNITGCGEPTAHELDFKPFVLFKVETVIVWAGLYLFVVRVGALKLPMVRRPWLCDCYLPVL